MIRYDEKKWRTTCHSRKSVHWYSSQFRVYTFVRAFIACQELTLKTVYFYSHIIALHYAHARAQFHSRLRGIGSICLEFITAPVRTIFEHSFNDTPMKFVSGCTNLSRTDSFRLLRRAIHAISNCLLPIDNRGRLYSSNDFDKFVASLFPRAVFFSCIKQG